MFALDMSGFIQMTLYHLLSHFTDIDVKITVSKYQNTIHRPVLHITLTVTADYSVQNFQHRHCSIYVYIIISAYFETLKHINASNRITIKISLLMSYKN